MSMIRITPTQLRMAAQDLRTNAQQIKSALERTNEIIGNLDPAKFEGRQADEIRGKFQMVQGRLSGFPMQVIRLAMILEEISKAFEAEDKSLASGVADGPKDRGQSDSPFVRGMPDSTDIHPSDVSQGHLGDCYLMASVAVLAQQNPEQLKRLIRDNGDGTYTITFYEKKGVFGLFGGQYEKVEITVTADFPQEDGQPIYAGYGDQTSEGKETWVMLLEKGYAQWKGGYEVIGKGGFPHNAMEALTGIDSIDYKPGSISIQDLENRYNSGSAITLGSLTDYELFGLDIPDATNFNPLYQNDTLVSNHAYYVSDVNVNEGTITIRNPWGWEHEEIVLTYDEFKTAFSKVTING